MKNVDWDNVTGVMLAGDFTLAKMWARKYRRIKPRRPRNRMDHAVATFAHLEDQRLCDRMSQTDMGRVQ